MYTDLYLVLGRNGVLTMRIHIFSVLPVCFRSGNPVGESSENTGNCKQIQQTILSCLMAALEKTNLAMEDTHVYNASIARVDSSWVGGKAWKFKQQDNKTCE